MKTDETNFVRNREAPPRAPGVEQMARVVPVHARADAEREADAFDLWRAQRHAGREEGGAGGGGAGDDAAARYRRGAAMAASEAPHGGLADIASIHGLDLADAPEAVRAALAGMGADLAELHRALEAATARIERLERAVDRDGLTGLLDRNGLAHETAHVRSLDAREGSASTLAMVRIAGTAGIREAHGRAALDGVLQGVADALAAAVAPGEILGVLGEGEFGVILPGRDAEAARARITEILGAALARPARVDGRDRPLDAEVGLAPAASGDAPLAAWARADADLRAGA